MPIPVACQSCGAKLNAPDAAAGKRVKCPKCQAILTIPALAPPPAPLSEPEGFAFEESADVAPPSPRKKPKPPVEKNEEDAPDDERPMKKSKREKKATNPLIFVAIAGAALVLFGALAFGLWYYFVREPQPEPYVAPGTSFGERIKAPSPKSPVPDGWELYERPEYFVFFPKEGTPPKSDIEEAKEGYTFTEGHSTTKVLSSDPLKLLEIDAFQLKDGIVERYEAKPDVFIKYVLAIEKNYKNFNEVVRKDVTVEGTKAVETLVEIDGEQPGTRVMVALRIILVKKRMYHLSMMGDKLTLDDPTLRTFFDSFVSK